MTEIAALVVPDRRAELRREYAKITEYLRKKRMIKALRNGIYRRYKRL